MAPIKHVVIVGAGPAGLLLGLMLGQAGIKSTILEAWSTVDKRLRATQYGTPATRVLRKAGVLEDIRAAGYRNFPSICWRKTSTKEEVARIDLGITRNEEDRITVIPLAQMLEVILEHIKKLPEGICDVRFGHRVVDLGQDEKSAWVDVEVAAEHGAEQDGEIVGDKEKVRFEGDYVVGCDGGKSTVRKKLFGSEWPGVTHPHELFVCNVFYDGFDKAGWDGGNYMVDPNHWGLIAKRKPGTPCKPALWRVTYGDKVGLTQEEYLKAREDKFRKMLPGAPEPEQYTTEQTDRFKTHNRCVTSMRVGRVMVAADAAHVCTPYGGYGCMAGIVDIGGLVECLVGISEGKTDDDILTKWSEIRVEKFLRYIGPRSIKNMQRLHKPDVIDEDKFMLILKDLNDKGQDDMKAFLLKYTSFEHDFTQYYHTAPAA
ncbi:FAD/NAD(P)-binding domain-containing protein [Rhizodiscina lignyota]|uniref:FAD/NAD(P)-binding domain-containing protein n=1 Tax=Rhizodiscina lignyota TaxID=1504668 RepID=A0A9P4M2C7_9PEZI|nr:FAD/NAD(P)-binding domain-containing protein [Rhizodiscina lignyota]